MQESSQTILMIRSGERTLGVPIGNVIEVVPAYELHRSPGMPAAMAGMISLRGDVLPVVDTAVLVGAGPLTMHPQHKFLIVQSSARLFALLAETVEDLLEIDRSRLITPMHAAGGHPVAGLIAVGDEMVLVLDIDACGEADGILRWDELESAATEYQGQRT
jgi:purine-binding chemotaxis protein CheW